MTTCRKWCLIGACLIGIVIFAASLGAFFYFPTLISKTVKEKLPLRNGSMSMAKWAKVSVPIYLKVHVFDVQNVMEVESKGAEPIVVERGPFVFYETREKNVVSYENDSNVIHYNDVKTFYFKPELSVGSLDDPVNVVNVPLVGLIEKLKEREPESASFQFILSMINQIISNSGERIILRKKVREILFDGYKVTMFDRINEFVNRFGHSFPSSLPNNTFGVMYGKNGTNVGPYSVNAGIKDIKQFGKIESFKDRPHVPHWSGETCNQINGTDGSAFHPGIKRDETVYVFNTELCRSLFMTYDRDSEVRGIPVYKFTVPERFFKAPSNHPDNECFCTKPQGLTHPLCSVDGVLDISRCRKGAPILLSAPHFYQGADILRNNVKGLFPEKLKHETFLEIEPMTGLVLNAARRIQININVQGHKSFPSVSRVKSVIMPLLWIEESATADDPAASRFKAAIQNKLILGNAILITVMTLSLALFLICFILLILYMARRSQAKLHEKALEASRIEKSNQNIYQPVSQSDKEAKKEHARNALLPK